MALLANKKPYQKKTPLSKVQEVSWEKKVLPGKFQVRKEKNIHIGLVVYERMMKRDSREVTYWHYIFIFA